MLHKLLFMALLALAGIAQAQAVINCTGGGNPPNRCTAVTDPAPPLPTVQPATCKIYNSATGAFVLASGPVSGPVGALYCSIALPTMAAGIVTLSAAFVGTDGIEGPRGAAITVNVGIPVITPPLPAPTNLRVTSP